MGSARSTRPGRRRLGASARLLAMTLGSLVLLAGCGSGEVPAGSRSAANDLHRAAQATLASSSFVVHVAGTNGSAGEMTVVYQAPDRFHTTYASGESEMITIGRTVYARFGTVAPPPMPGVETVPGLSDGSVPQVGTAVPPGTFQRIQSPASGPSPGDGSLAQLRTLADAGQVDWDGARYRWRTGSGKSAVSGDAHVDQGKIADFTFLPADPAWTGSSVTYRITDYDHAPPVEPPPADKVIDAPAMSPCPSDGSPPPGQGICDPSNLATTTTRPLPAPTVSGPSPLELRAVLSVDKGACPPPAGGPIAEGEVRLGGADGCYHLGPTLVTIRRASAHGEQYPGGVTVALDLSPADGSALRSVLSGQVGRQFAMVMFGRVLSAPTVKDPNYTTDSIAIAPLDPQTAANVIKSLDG